MQDRKKIVAKIQQKVLDIAMKILQNSSHQTNQRNIFMSFIGNYSRQAVHQGLHFQPNRKAVLIQISDVDSQPLDPMYSFKEIHRFWFDDAEDSSDGVCISLLQAKEIAAILRDALRNGSDVVVNCHAGLCRSGAITEVGVMLGFQDAETERIPNQLVKKMLLQELGLSFDPEFSVFNS